MESRPAACIQRAEDYKCVSVFAYLSLYPFPEKVTREMNIFFVKRNWEVTARCGYYFAQLIGISYFSAINVA
ncbi:hypothetical protein CJD36_022790 [Flavipsychrobacter stenotrophus]|uniref:Uncharacterized protein n=1 Tax=Flavipsychrobacter stenotrophus TaxID=2077091 RepID=A0A2S7SPA2_9BACT|nr:hypothetical protein CJD36_022790 [Flavipsychrobacter stenotrophus]